MRVYIKQMSRVQEMTLHNESTKSHYEFLHIYMLLGLYLNFCHYSQEITDYSVCMRINEHAYIPAHGHTI